MVRRVCRSVAAGVMCAIASLAFPEHVFYWPNRSLPLVGPLLGRGWPVPMVVRPLGSIIGKTEARRHSYGYPLGSTYGYYFVPVYLFADCLVWAALAAVGEIGIEVSCRAIKSAKERRL